MLSMMNVMPVLFLKANLRVMLVQVGLANHLSDCMIIFMIDLM